MTRSSVNNAAELRQMSNPIPISVNTWRDPSQSIDDSTQFDPGIIDQCISQSLSPGSAAYSLSPTSYAYQTRNSPGGGGSSNTNSHQNPGLVTLNLPQQQQQQPIQPMGSQSTITLSDNIQSNNLIGQSFLGGSGATDQGIDFSSHDVDLEALLVNTTLSDNNCFTLSAPPSCGDPSSSNENTSMNIMHNNNINNSSNSETSLLTANSSSMGSALSPSNSKMNQADEENVNNNINPIFVFNGNKTGTQIMLGNKESTNAQPSKMIKSSSSGNGGRAIFINQRINKIDEEEDNYQPAISSSSNQTIRSILEQQQQQQQQNHQFSTSLPSTSSYLTNSNMKMNSSSFINYEFGINNDSSSTKNDGGGGGVSSRKDHHQVTVGLQRNDPVLTQFVLNQNSVNNSGNLIGNNSSIATGNNNMVSTNGSRVTTTAGGFMSSTASGGQQHHTQQQHHHLLINQLQSNSSQQQAQQMLTNNGGQQQKIELNSNYFIYSANGSNAATAASITILPTTTVQQQQSNQSGFINQPYSSSLPANYGVNGGFDFKIKNEPQSVGSGAGSHLGDIVEDDRFSRLQIHSPLMSGHHHFGDTPSASVSPNSGVPLDMFDLKRGSNQTTASMDSGLGSSGNAANNNASLINDLFIDMATTPSPNTTQNSNSNNDYTSIMDVNRIANDLKIESMGFQNQQQQQQMLQDENEFEDDDEYDDDDDEDDDEDEEEDDDDEDDDDEDENEEDEFTNAQTRQPMYVGSVGTGSLAYMMQKQQQQQQPINSRKHAKINNTVGATDVHHSSSTTLNQMASSVGNKLFSNVQFAGFSNQPQQAQQQQQQIIAHQANAYRFNPGINIINQQQQQQHQSLMQPQQSQLISTSLPPMSTIDSIMFLKSEQNAMGQPQQLQPQSGFLNLQPINFIQQQQQQQQQGKSVNDHPNLNKLLSSGPMLNQKSGLNLLNNDLLQPQIAIKSEAMDLHYLQPQQQMGRPANSSSIKQSVAQKQPTPRKLSNSFKPKKPTQSAAQATKKRQKKKQELFDDDISDSDEDSDENSDNDDYDSDEDMTGGVKAEPCDMDSDSQMTNTTTTNSVSQQHSASKRGRSAKQLNSGSIGSNLSYNSPFMNSESMFDLMMSSKSRDAYFWQYNTQSKGPKTKKVLTLRNKDPHLHRDFYDPVFQLQSLNSRAGGANTGAANKLRKGDGNDVTPNPEKLYNLGHQIRDFIQKSYQMNNACFGTNGSTAGAQQQILFSGGTTPINHTLSASLDNSQLLSTSFPTEKVNLKREKNKIASRACRLKKKAQHEANKIKLFGLNEEHKQLINCISSVRSLIKTRLHDSHSLPANKHMVDMMDEITKVKLRTKVAGNTDGYVHGLMLLIESARANRPNTGSRSSKPAPVDLTGFTAQFNQSPMGNSNTNLNANTAGASGGGGGLSTSVSASASFDNSSQATTQSYLNYQAEDNQMEDLQFGGGGQTNIF